MEAVLEIMIPVIIPFNLVKAGINAVVTYLVYKPIARLVRHEHFEAAPQNP